MSVVLPNSIDVLEGCHIGNKVGRDQGGRCGSGGLPAVQYHCYLLAMLGCKYVVEKCRLACSKVA